MRVVSLDEIGSKRLHSDGHVALVDALQVVQFGQIGRWPVRLEPGRLEHEPQSEL